MQDSFPSGIAQSTKYVMVRGWESCAASLGFDLDGPGAEALIMPPAPTLEFPELINETMELY